MFLVSCFEIFLFIYIIYLFTISYTHYYIVSLCVCVRVFDTGVAKLYSEQRAIRVKRIVDRKRLYISCTHSLYLYMYIMPMIHSIASHSKHHFTNRVNRGVCNTTL